jgi:hypothetical protein
MGSVNYGSKRVGSPRVFPRVTHTGTRKDSDSWTALPSTKRTNAGSTKPPMGEAFHALGQAKAERGADTVLMSGE